MSEAQQMDNDNKNDKLLCERQADFAFDLLRLVASKTGKNDKRDEKEDGIILSPLSISIALAMVYVGAEGETAEELAKLLTGVSNSEEQKLKTQQFFGGLCQEFLHKKIQEEEKARKEAEEEEDEKRRKIDEEKLEVPSTEEAKEGKSTDTDTDNDNKGIKEIICTYGDGKCKCIVALANKIYLAKGYPILENYKATIGQYYAGLFEQLDLGEEQSIKVSLPKFKLESSFMMNNELEKLGLETAFNADKANFEGIVGAKNGDKGERGNLHISETFQKAFIEVNEEGSEAAGVSRICLKEYNFCFTGGGSYRREPKPIIFNADHPFAFVLFLPCKGEGNMEKKEKGNGHFLFVGTFPKYNVLEPEQSTSNTSRKSSMDRRIWEHLTRKIQK